MGKSSKLVTIIVTEREMLNWDGFKKLAEQGHRILALEDLIPETMTTHPPFALVMGPRAHLLLPGMEAMVPVALKSARAGLYAPTPVQNAE